MNPRVLVTGGQGLVGRALATRVLAQGLKVRVSTRRKPTTTDLRLEYFQTTDMSFTTDWLSALHEVDVVVHCAARVHVMHDTEADPLATFRSVNLEGTLSLARQAADAGVKRFVFISSVKVNGEATQLGSAFAADDAPAPLDAYGVSKMEAEQGLRDLAARTGMEVVIIRPPLVYGPGVKANFAAMMRWLQRGVPLPLGAVHNQRSLVALDNLVDLIVTCLMHPAAANQTFLVSDGEDVSTTELLRRMGRAMGHPARLVPVPAGLLKLAATMLGKRDMVQRLCGSLQVDIEKTRRLLDWTPPLSLDQGLKKAAEGYGCKAGI
jgi:nucleoside-diphosphate-sugar epimerase